MKTNLLSTFVVLFFLPACPCFQGLTGTPGALPALSATAQLGPSEGTLTVNEVARHYRLYVPKNFTGSPPLVLNFHGLGAASLEEEGLSGMSAAAEQGGFIIVYPDGLNKAWNDGGGQKSRGDLQFASDLVAALRSRYAIDNNIHSWPGSRFLPEITSQVVNATDVM